MSQEKNVFTPHPDLSSQVDLDVALGVITKVRPQRSVGNLLNEARALLVWDTVLAAYNEAVDEPGHIASPKLLSVEREPRALQMAFRPGLHLGRAFALDHDFRQESLPCAEVRQDIAYRIGSLAGIKTVEQFVHGDYQQRHLLYQPLIRVDDTRRLSVIDVESSRQTDHPEEVSAENDSMYEWFMSTASKRQQPALSEAYYDGFSTAYAHAPRGIFRDALSEALREIQ